jgi:two-component system NarL family sensor kinase
MEPTNSEFFIMFSIATVGMLLLAGAIVLFVLFYQKRMLQEQLKRQLMEADFQQKMLQAALDSQENERRRLAGDLHDSIGAMLSTIRVGLSTMVRKDDVAAESIVQTKQMLDDTIESVRSISRDLMPSTLEKFGLTQAIKEMCEKISSTTKLPIAFQEDGTAVPLEKNKEVMLFRVTQELLNNALKHSQATAMSVITHWNHDLLITVEDNGIGFDPSLYRDTKGNSKGLGLFNIENRARLLAASVLYDKPVDHSGTRVTLRLPIKK